MNIPEGYLAAFDNDIYEGIATLCDNAVSGSEIKSQEYLSSYNGEENVLKLELLAMPNYAGMLNHYVPVAIKLPKGYTDAGYTIKMCAENVSDGTFGLAKNSDWNNYYYTFDSLANNEWKTVYVDTDSSGDLIYISWIYSNEVGSLDTRNINIYLSFVKEGDARDPGKYEGDGDGSVYQPESPFKQN